MLRQIAATHDVVWAAFAPTACAAAMTIAMVLPKPTRAAMKAEETMEGRKPQIPMVWKLCGLARARGVYQFADSCGARDAGRHDEIK